MKDFFIKVLIVFLFFVLAMFFYFGFKANLGLDNSLLSSLLFDAVASPLH